MTNMRFKEPPRFMIYGINPEGGDVAFRAGAKSQEEAKDRVWLEGKSYPSLTWRVFEATWKEVDITAE